MNLLKETELFLHNNELLVDDITFIGSSDGRFSCSWKEFEILANKEYDSGFGGQNVATDLVILMNSGKIIKRKEYDGSEWWELICQPPRYNCPKGITNLFCLDPWENLATIHGDGDL